MTGRTMYDRAARAISGSNLSKPQMIMVDPDVTLACIRLKIFHKRKDRVDNPTLSQWIYDQMVEARKKHASAQSNDMIAPDRMFPYRQREKEGLTE